MIWRRFSTTVSNNSPVTQHEQNKRASSELKLMSEESQSAEKVMRS